MNLRELFRSPAKLQDDAATAFESRGFTEAEARQAARELALACRAGRKTPKWIMDKLRESPR